MNTKQQDYDAGIINVKAKYLTMQCGLAGTLLLPHHVQLIRDLAAALPKTAGGTMPLNGVTERTLPAVRSILQQLPQTPEVRQYLARTVNGPLIPTKG